jgi:hypothetical protein
MKPNLTNKYFIKKIVSSGNPFELYNNATAYLEFIKFRRDYASSLYCKSIRENDINGVIDAMTIRLH